jgi:hypothetical protein
MGSFLKYLFKLTLMVVVFLLPILLIYNKNLSNSEKEIRRSNYENQEILILGSSQARLGVLDGIIENSYNLAFSSFSLEETYMELIRLKNIHVFPKTVIISFSPYSLHETNTSLYGRNIFDEYNYGKNIVVNFFQNPNRKDIIIPSYSSISRVGIEPQKKNTEEEIDLNAKKTYLARKGWYSNNKGLEYFELINNYCRKHRIRLIYMVFPFSSAFNNYLSNEEIWINDLNFMKNENNNFEFYDFSKYFLDVPFEPEYFRDATHLNSNGSLIFTEYINELLFNFKS